MRGVLLALLPGLLWAQTGTTSTGTSGPAKSGTSSGQTARRTGTGSAVKPKPKAAATETAPALTTDDQKTIYALGLSLYQTLGQFSLSPEEVNIIERAMADAAAGKPAEELDVWGPKIQKFAEGRAAIARQKQQEAAKAYLDKAAGEPGVVKTDSGMLYQELQAGTGAVPKATDTVKVNYRGTFVDGKEFDSSYKRNQPLEFPLSGVIRCWTEGVQKMKVGGKAKLVCPSGLAYGDRGRPGIPGGSTLIFEIELLDITAGNAAAPPTPAAPGAAK